MYAVVEKNRLRGEIQKNFSETSNPLRLHFLTPVLLEDKRFIRFEKNFIERQREKIVNIY